jgi:hypothetical protein
VEVVVRDGGESGDGVCLRWPVVVVVVVLVYVGS